MYTWNQTDHGQLEKTADKSSEEKVKIETNGEEAKPAILTFSSGPLSAPLWKNGQYISFSEIISKKSLNL